MVNILFATNRNEVGAGTLSPFGTDGISSNQNLFYGTATVDQININAPSSGTITAIDYKSQVSFSQDQLAPLLASSNDVLLFVHGCANDFTDSITRAAYNQTWLAASNLANSTFDVIAFSWPARSYFMANILGDYADYRADQAAATGSAAFFSSFLGIIGGLRGQIPRKRRMNLLCHSMGNFMLGGVLPNFVAGNSRGMPIFDEIVLAAADEPANTFNVPNPARFSGLNAVGREITIYFNNNDIAMDLSHLVNSDYRLGYDGPANMADTTFFPPSCYKFVDCTGVNDYISDWITAPDRSHQYYRQSPTVRKDIVMSLAGFTPTRSKYDPKANSYSLFPSGRASA
jgi:esterase/lipase superfamily enzyme